ncbi:heme exporter protein C [Erythrobacter litoralis]|jgi:heme exporter protein C|uniref:Heme exporter protein C n=1 Tax=Erythrobacter litoralis TaxID=39960 RepID=A0A074MUE5_9SPHN|nr:heme ABC transporter permease CcmC [Erythrobacter litoralis]AOL23903.1 heme exporter protein C [Erythrobacter litoralis]KEO98616.1 heme ABC transporter permease [Erythrobacter litoralis]MEE4337356.1 heme ABC transporter permease CcmC [Erythrobacter sp.]
MHTYANPKRFLGIAKWLMPLLFWSGLALSAGAVAWGLAVVPPDRLMGESVRILFIHVPAAWLGMGGWAGIAISSAMLLIWKHPLAGISARAIAVPGMVFTAVCLATGSIWGRPTWGTWWVWDGRLTSMLVLLFLYAGYIALVQATTREGGSAKIAAIFGLVGAVNIPIINRSVVWWNSLHQPPSITMGNSAIDGVFLMPLLAAVVGFSLLFGAIVLMRMRAIIAEAQVEARLKRRALDDDAPRGGGAGEPAMGGA